MSTDAGERPWLVALGGVLTGLLILAPGLAIFTFFVLIPAPPPAPAAVRAGDRAVVALLESRDPVDLQRAGLLIEYLRCDVERRLPAPQ